MVNSTTLKKLRQNCLGPAAFANVDLSNSGLGSKDLEAVSSNILKNINKNPEIVSAVVTISFAGNNICGMTVWGDGDYDYKGLKSFTGCCVNRSKQFRVRRINFSRNNLGKRGFDYVADMIANLQNLTEISLRDCCGDGSCMEKLIDSFEKNKSLIQVDLRQNSLELDGAKYLAKCMKINKRIKSLELSNCTLGSDGCSWFSESLLHNTSLTFLSLAGNEIGNNGFSALMHALNEKNGSVCQLAHLDLQENGLTDSAMKDLSTCLRNNRFLQCIALQWNEISNMGASNLAIGLAENVTIKSILLFGNPITEVGVTTLLNARNNATDSSRVNGSSSSNNNSSSSHANHSSSSSHHHESTNNHNNNNSSSNMLSIDLGLPLPQAS